MSVANLASITNQKIDTARRFLSQSQSASEKWINVGLESSAIFQLKSALNGLYKEVAAAYSLRSSLKLEELLSEASSKQLVIPVLNELSGLMSRSDSWLIQLENAFLVQFECRTSTVVEVDNNLISQGGDAGASVAFYLSNLVELILRFREESSEY